MKRYLAFLLFGVTCCHAQPHLPPGVTPLLSSAPEGQGPLALMNLNHHVLGSAKVYGGPSNDLFVSGHGGEQQVYLFRRVGVSKEGSPVFAPPVTIECDFKDRGTIFQTQDGSIQGLWIVKEELVHTLFDKEALAFREKGRMKLDPKLKSPPAVGTLENADGSLDLVFEMAGPGSPLLGKNSTEEWRPYNSSGIVRGDLRYKYLFGARLPSLLKGPLDQVKQITASHREVYYTMHKVIGVNLGQGHERDLMTGSRQGNLVHYQNSASQGFSLSSKHLCAGEDRNALRHPSINSSICAYPNEEGLSDIIAGGEGALYFYRFTGRFTDVGAPIYQEPVPVLQQQADLYAGTLPSPTTVDWNGDGTLDILVGNSEGFVLFFENIGSNEQPRFLPGTRLQAGGREIQVQAGYSGSLQGLQEARWGYLSPNVVDWNEDGLPDIITGDITGNYLIYLNHGNKTEPLLEAARPLYCDGIDLRGMWRCRPAVGKINGRMALALVDGDDHFHLYRRIDDYNVEDVGKLLMADDRKIGASGGVGGMSGRCKLDFFDWNQDGKMDLVIGTARVNSIPDRETGLPMPAIGKKTLGTPLLMLNVGTESQPRFAMPVPFRDDQGDIIQPGGAHETGAVGTLLGGKGPNLLICNEAGRMFLIPGSKVKAH